MHHTYLDNVPDFGLQILISQLHRIRCLVSSLHEDYMAPALRCTSSLKPDSWSSMKWHAHLAWPTRDCMLLQCCIVRWKDFVTDHDGRFMAKLQASYQTTSYFRWSLLNESSLCRVPRALSFYFVNRANASSFHL